jgi:hypothetical protein
LVTPTLFGLVMVMTPVVVPPGWIEDGVKTIDTCKGSSTAAAGVAKPAAKNAIEARADSVARTVLKLDERAHQRPPGIIPAKIRPMERTCNRLKESR